MSFLGSLGPDTLRRFEEGVRALQQMAEALTTITQHIQTKGLVINITVNNEEEKTDA